MRRRGSDAVEGCVDNILSGRSLGVDKADVDGSIVRIGLVSSRFGVEDAETKLSFDDLELPVEGLTSGSSSKFATLDSSCPSLLAMSDCLRVPSAFVAAGRRAERSLLFLGALGRVPTGLCGISVNWPGELSCVVRLTVLLESDCVILSCSGLDAGGFGLVFFIGTPLNSS